MPLMTAEEQSPQHEQEPPKVLGKPVDRIDGRKKVTGQALYAADGSQLTGSRVAKPAT